jgi:hypothetical protein
MRYVWFAVLLGTLVLAGCNEGESPLNSKVVVPHTDLDWLNELIASLEEEPVRNPPAFIAQSTYKGSDVYYLPPYCCDAFGTLFNAEGAVICHPDGGLTGDGDGRCPDFFEAKPEFEIIWQDDRQR